MKSSSSFHHFVLFLFLIVVFAFVSGCEYTMIPIADNASDDLASHESIQINDNGYVVWIGDTVEEDQEIFLYDGTSTTQLSNNDGLFLCNPHINNNGYVVWDRQYLFAPGISEVFLYDGTSTIQLTNNDDADWGPQINDNGWVVWTGERDSSGGDTEIFLYDGTTTIQLTDNDYYDYVPQINNIGWVVWQGCDYYDCDVMGDSYIFLYDGTNTTRLDYGEYPQINDNGWVVWVGPSAQGIFLYDGTSIRQISDDSSSYRDNYPYGDYYPKINNNGYVVWSGCDGDCRQGDYDGDYEIFLYDGTTTVQLTDNDDDDDFKPKINNDGYVVWEGCIGGYYPYYPFCTEGDIFLYDGTTTIQLTEYNVYFIDWYYYFYNDIQPQINDNEQVVWIRQGDKAYIFLGNPTPEYLQPANAIAASYGSNSLVGSGMVNELVLFIIPLSVVIVLRVRRRRK